jgi:hypothetical protein
MPSIIVQDVNGDSRVLGSKPYPYEDILKRNIVELPSLLPLEAVSDEPVSHMTIGEEWPAGTGRADIVLIGSDAVLTIVETKLSRNPEARREVIAQLLEYAAYLSEWTIFEIQHRADEFFRSQEPSFDQALETFLGDSGTEEGTDSFKSKIEQNLRQGRIRLIVAVDEVGEQIQKIVTFVNSYSSFELYLLQIASYEDSHSRRIFVPSLYGYARKISTTRTRVEWNWEKFKTELGWSEEEVDGAQRLIRRLESVSQSWQPEARFYRGGMSVYCYDRYVYGAEVSRKRGLELWFRLEQSPRLDLPADVRSRKTKYYLFLSGKLDSLDDAQLHRLCEAALKELGLEPPSHE